MANPFAEPLCILDLETTGTDIANDRIVEIGIVRLEVDGSRTEFHSVVNPLRPIPAGATAVHHITDAIAGMAPPFAAIATDVLAFIGNCAVGGYNCLSFDLPLLGEELARAGHPTQWATRPCVDVMRIYHAHHAYTKETPRRLMDAVQLYLGRPHMDAHTALADTRATLDILLAQVEGHQTPTTLAELCQHYGSAINALDTHNKVRLNEEGELVFAFGKHNNNPVRNHLDYVEWMASVDFAPSTLALINKYLAEGQAEGKA